jgi:phosphoglycolate phosphatase
MRYRLFIFDFDGTLSDSFGWFTRALNSIADEYGFRKVAEHEVGTLRSCRPREVMARLGIPLWKTPLIARRLRKLMARDLDRISLFRGAGDLLRQLAHRGATLALVTSNSRENVRRLMGPEIFALIEHCECGTSTFGKSARLRRVLRRSGVPHSQTISIGDEIRDLEAARRVGIAFGAVAWGYNQVESLRASSPDELFESFQDIARKVA